MIPTVVLRGVVVLKKETIYGKIGSCRIVAQLSALHNIIVFIVLEMFTLVTYYLEAQENTEL